MGSIFMALSFHAQNKKVALASLPLKELPTFLYPVEDRTFNPPVFHFGYLFEIEWLLEFAEEHNLQGHLYDEHDDDMYLCDELTMEKVMEFITEQAGITTFKLMYEVKNRSPGVPFGAILMSIASNYRRLRINDEEHVNPSPEDVLKLQKYLGRTEPSMWYLDSLSPCNGWGIRRRSLRV